MERIDLGYAGYRLSLDGKDIGMIFGTEERAKQEMSRYTDNQCVISHHDTRPFISTVLERIKKAEGHVWDEYMSIDYDLRKGNEKWPEEGRTKIYVVTGGSEGLYLHIDIGDKNIILGKTLLSGQEAWANCYASAGRIAWMLSA